MSKKRIAGVAGRSGGHIIPCITRLVDGVENASEYEIILFSTATELDKSILALYPHIKHIPLRLESFPGRRIARYPSFVFQCIRTFISSLKILRKERVTRLMSTGGYISLPVCAAAWFLRIPFEGYELNVIPGKALKQLAPYSTTLYVCFDETIPYFKGYTCVKVAYPLRFKKEDLIAQEDGKAHYKLDSSKKTLLILGGSQGSQALNKLVERFFNDYPHYAQQVQVIHQTGATKSALLKDFYFQKGVKAHVFEYEHALQYAYAAADYVIARAGAGTLFELEFFKKRSLIIPLEASSNTHQIDNAQAFVKKDPLLFSMAHQKTLEIDPTLFSHRLKEALNLL